MPPVRSVTIEKNSLVIVSHYGTLTLHRNDIPKDVLRTKDIPTVEAWVNDWLAQPEQRAVTGCYVAVHVFSVEWTLEDIEWTFCCSDYPITGEWWL